MSANKEGVFNDNGGRLLLELGKRADNEKGFESEHALAQIVYENEDGTIDRERVEAMMQNAKAALLRLLKSQGRLRG